MIRDKSEGERPPIPDTWGSEDALPTQPYELMDEDVQSFVIHEAEIKVRDLTPTDLSPVEEYLQMTKRLIESNSLSPHNTAILKELYVRYKSMRNHDGATRDAKPFGQDKRNKIGKTGLTDPGYEGHSFETDKSSMCSKKDATAEHKVSRVGEEKPSMSKERGQLEASSSTESVVSDKFNRRLKVQKVKLHQERFQTVYDLGFDYFCDPELFEINNIFSDFSLCDMGFGRTLRRRLTRLIYENKDQPGSSKNS